MFIRPRAFIRHVKVSRHFVSRDVKIKWYHLWMAPFHFLPNTGWGMGLGVMCLFNIIVKYFNQVCFKLVVRTAPPLTLYTDFNCTSKIIICFLLFFSRMENKCIWCAGCGGRTAPWASRRSRSRPTSSTRRFPRSRRKKGKKRREWDDKRRLFAHNPPRITWNSWCRVTANEKDRNSVIYSTNQLIVKL